MRKIPTLFVRDPANMGRVTREVTPGCEWVLAGEGFATRKWDGTNVRVTMKDGALVNFEKRRNPTREEKAQGAEPGYVETSSHDPSDKHIITAAASTDFSAWPDGEWPCEALGPKIQGGTDSDTPRLVEFSIPAWARICEHPDVPRDFDGLSEFLGSTPWEGIVWHHPDGRMTKIKRRDFGHPWPARARRGLTG